MGGVFSWGFSRRVSGPKSLCLCCFFSQKCPDIHKIAVHKIASPCPPEKVSILRMSYWFVQFFLILDLFRGTRILWTPRLFWSSPLKRPDFMEFFTLQTSVGEAVLDWRLLRQLCCCSGRGPQHRTVVCDTSFWLATIAHAWRWPTVTSQNENASVAGPRVTLKTVTTLNKEARVLKFHFS